MPFQELDRRRQLLFTAVNEAKLVVNTEEFSSKVDIVTERGLQFALQTGLLSKNPEQELEDLFSSNIADKKTVIDELLRILGFRNPFNFGPGPQELIGGDMTNGYFGEVSASELFTGEELVNWVNDINPNIFGIERLMNSNSGWLKFARYGNIIYVAKKPIHNSIRIQRILDEGLALGLSNNKQTISKSTNDFVIRLLTGSEEYQRNVNSIIGTGSEWNELLYRVHEQFGDWESFNYVDIGMDDSGSGARNFTQEFHTSSFNPHVARGSQNDITGVSNVGNGLNTMYGWRPVLALQQTDGSYSKGTEHYPS